MGQARLTSTDHSSSWPEFLRQAATGQISHDGYRPKLVDMAKAGSAKALDKLVMGANITDVIDVYDEQLAELFLSSNAQLYKANAEVKSASIASFLDEHYAGKGGWELGTWVYYPWSGQLMHCLDAGRFNALRTLRNRFLLTDEEQGKWADFRVGCAGMSVGSNGATGIVLTGGSSRIKLADGAVISGSNLNRLPLAATAVGTNKAVAVARRLYEMNPFLEIEAVTANLGPDSLDAFFDAPWPLDLIVDEIDDLPTKVRLRLEAKKRRIPLIMVTEPGNDAIIDIERYDLDPGLPIFNGRAPGIESLLAATKPPTQREFIKYFNQIVGVRNLSARDQDSMTKVGSVLPSPPQLGSTAMFTGGVIAYVARQIALGADLPSGRHIISLDSILPAPSIAAKLAHRRRSQALINAMKSM